MRKFQDKIHTKRTFYNLRFLSKFSFILCIGILQNSIAAYSPKPGIDKVASEIQNTKEEYRNFETQKRVVLSKLYEINKQKRKISIHKNELTNQLLTKKANAKNLAKVIGDLEKKVSVQQRLLRKKLKTIFQVGRNGPLEIIFTSASIQDLDRNLYFLKKMAENDHSLMKNYTANLEMILKRKINLNQEVEKLVSVEKKVSVEEKKLRAQQQEKSQLIQSLNEKTKQNLLKLQLVREKANNMQKSEDDQELADLFRPSFFESKGKLPAPIVGKIARGFGLEQHSEYKYRLSHKGLFYGAELGQPIAAIFSGKVVYAGPREGYQNVVVIDHGDHFFSVYSHMQKLQVSENQDVVAGSIIAESGIDPIRQESGLYFEIRHFSEPEDPLAWLKDGELKVSALPKDPDTL
jgi:septal ring factor EnvC (AmiA/AmiB activator)